MIRYIVYFILLSNFLFSQSKIDWFFSNEKNKELLSSEIQLIINPELNAISENFNTFFQEKLTSENYTYISGKSFDNDGYTSALLSLNNPTQAEADYLRSLYTKKFYDTKSKIREIEVDKEINKKSPTWTEVVNYIGGYAKLSERKIDKSNLTDFELLTILSSIKFNENNDEVVIKIRFSGDKKALEYYNIDNQNIELSLKFKLRNLTYIDINRISKKNYKNDGILKFKLNQPSDYLSNNDLQFSLNNVFEKDIDLIFNEAKKINSIITQMINDVVSDNYYSSMNHVKIANKKAEEKRIAKEKEQKESFEAMCKDYAEIFNCSYGNVFMATNDQKRNFSSKHGVSMDAVKDCDC